MKKSNLPAFLRLVATSFTRNGWLKILALVLAIVIYYTLKQEEGSSPRHDSPLLQQLP